ncbi:MAG: hypothetical protein ACHRHE_08110 [Tepidisphaerales bacterium]
MKTQLATALCLLCTLAAAGQNLPRPLAEHPGNIFLAGEEVDVAAPAGTGAVKLLDYDGKTIQEITDAGARVKVGRLAVGYYELRREGAPAVSIGVLSPLRCRRRPPRPSPSTWPCPGSTSPTRSLPSPTCVRWRA